MKKWGRKLKMPFLITAIVLVALLFANGGVISVENPNGIPTIGIGQKVITIGTEVHAAGTADYTCDGVADDVQFQAALDALPAGGGQLVALTGDYNFTATVTRALANVRISGTGRSSNFANDGVTAIFTAGGNNWSFSDLRTDAGGIALGATTGWEMHNVLLGATYYAYRSATGQAVFNDATVASLTDSGLTSGRVPIAGVGGLLGDDADLTFTGANTLNATNATVSGTLDAQTGRGATLIVAAAGSTALGQAQADYVCDGTADDVEINAALTAATGGEVTLLEGTYTTAANIVVPASTTLSGQGFGTIITPTGAAITRGIDVNGSNIHLKDFKIILAAGCGTGGARPNVIFADTKSLIWLENLWIVGDTSVADDGSNTRQSGVNFDTVTESKILGCRIEDNDRHSIYLTLSSNNTIIGNTCQGNSMHGIHAHTTCANNTITGNTCQGNAQEGIYLYAAYRNTVTGNTCQANAQNGILLGAADSTNNTITGNTCQGNTQNGIKLDTCNNNTITGNTCSDNDSGGNTYYGIQLTASDETVVTGNQCEGNGLHGIYVWRSSSCTISGNGCHNQNTGDGINVTGDGAGNADNNSICGNACTDNADDGIAFEGGANNNKNIVMGNQLLGNGGAALVDNGTNTVKQTAAGDAYNVVA